MSEMTCEKYLAEVKARAAAATPGPWAKNDGARGATIWAATTPTGSMQVAAFGHAEFDYRNAGFAAAARTDVPRLVAMVEQGLVIMQRFGCSAPNCGVEVAGAGAYLCDFCEWRAELDRLASEER